ncbi:MAG: ribonuclease HII, partial [Chloroflexota bacterium]
DLNLLPKAPNLDFEHGLWVSGIAQIAGVDEAGRGALAGPVSAGAVILPNHDKIMKQLDGVRDSKQISAKARKVCQIAIQEFAISWGVGFADQKEVDEIGIVPATRLAAIRAIVKLKPTAQHLLVDAIKIPGAGLPETTLIKGDARSLSIAAASILAKVTRDEYLTDLAEKYPGYGFMSNKGYGTKQHLRAIAELGPCKIHRFSFAPMRQQESAAGE